MISIEWLAAIETVSRLRDALRGPVFEPSQELFLIDRRQLSGV